MPLYLVGTPIGNLQDITLRALEVLKVTPILAVEKWNDTRKLLQAYNIKPEQIINFDDRTCRRTAPKILTLLESGHDVALVTSAGMPGVSDPGAYLVNECRKNNIEIIPIPGPSALSAAIATSGFGGPFLFIGFLPKKIGQIENLLRQAETGEFDLVFFESTHRFEKTMKLINDKYPTARIFVGKEMTKKFEQYPVWSPAEVLAKLATDKSFSKGEFTIIFHSNK